MYCRVWLQFQELGILQTSVLNDFGSAIYQTNFFKSRIRNQKDIFAICFSKNLGKSLKGSLSKNNILRNGEMKICHYMGPFHIYMLLC